MYACRSIRLSGIILSLYFDGAKHAKFVFVSASERVERPARMLRRCLIEDWQDEVVRVWVWTGESASGGGCIMDSSLSPQSSSLSWRTLPRLKRHLAGGWKALRRPRMRMDPEDSWVERPQLSPSERVKIKSWFWRASWHLISLEGRGEWEFSIERLMWVLVG
jgi:hypothetical protein